MKIKALKALTIRVNGSGDLEASEDESLGKFVSIAHGAIAEVPETVGSSLISDGVAEAYTLISPTGSINISSNGTVDVAEYASAEVNVAGVTPTGTIEITSNGTVDVTEYASAAVNVPGPTGSISITENGTVDVTNYASAVVSVQSGGGTTNLKNFVDRSITSVTDNMLTGVTSIGVHAFYGCTSLTRVEIPTSVESIGSYAFSGCSSLSNVELSPSADAVSAITTIGDNAFYECTSLTSVAIPYSVTNIGESAFITYVNQFRVTMNGANPPTLGAQAFGNPLNVTIYVPYGYVSIYQDANGWASYASRIQASPE